MCNRCRTNGTTKWDKTQTYFITSNRITPFTAVLMSKNIFQHFVMLLLQNYSLASHCVDILELSHLCHQGVSMHTTNTHILWLHLTFTERVLNTPLNTLTIIIWYIIIQFVLWFPWCALLNTIFTSVCSCCTPQMMSCVMINFDGRTDSPVSLSRPSEYSYDTVHQYETSRCSSGH